MIAFSPPPRHGDAHMLRFSIFGFHVTVELWFWITCVLLAGGLHPAAYSSVASVAWLGIWAIVAFFSILFHELGHATVGRKFGAYPEIVLHAFGGVAVMHGSRFNRRQDLLVTGAGPAASFLLGTLAWAVLTFLRPGDINFLETLDLMYRVNYFWTIINLLPIQPLDGGLLLRTALGDRRLLVTCTIGFICAAGVAVLALQSRNAFLTLLMAFLAFENWRMRPRT